MAPRYRGAVRRALRLCLLLGATTLVVVGCSGGEATPPIALPGASKPCRLLAQLAATADTLERADVGDPTTFQRAMDAAVARYVATVKELRPVAPASLRDDLDQLAAAVEQYRFQDGIGSARRARQLRARGVRAPGLDDDGVEREFSAPSREARGGLATRARTRRRTRGCRYPRSRPGHPTGWGSPSRRTRSGSIR